MDNEPPGLDRGLADRPSRQVPDSTHLRSLLQDPEPAVRGYVASDARTPHALLVELRKNPDENVRWGLSRNPNWTGDEIRQMYRDGASATAIAMNPSAPADVLEELVRRDDYGRRSALAATPRFPKRWRVDSLMTDIRLRLTYNPATPLDALTMLSKDWNGDVRRYAMNQIQKRAPDSR